MTVIPMIIDTSGFLREVRSSDATTSIPSAATSVANLTVTGAVTATTVDGHAFGKSTFTATAANVVSLKASAQPTNRANITEFGPSGSVTAWMDYTGQWNVAALAVNSNTNMTNLFLSGNLSFSGGVVIQANGTMSNATFLPGGNWITATSAETVGTTFNLNVSGQAGVWQSTGISITLPGAGTYIILWSPHIVLNATAKGTFVTCQLHNDTDGAAVANSELCGPVATDTGYNVQLQAASFAIVTVTAAKTISIQASYAFLLATTDPTAVGVGSGGGGRTKIEYIRLA